MKKVLLCALALVFVGVTTAEARGFSGGRSFSRPSFSRMHKAPAPKRVHRAPRKVENHTNVTKHTTVINTAPASSGVGSSGASNFLSTFGGSMAGSMAGSAVYDAVTDQEEQQPVYTYPPAEVYNTVPQPQVNVPEQPVSK